MRITDLEKSTKKSTKVSKTISKAQEDTQKNLHRKKANIGGGKTKDHPRNRIISRKRYRIKCNSPRIVQDRQNNTEKNHKVKNK